MKDTILEALEISKALVVVGHARRGCELPIERCSCDYARHRKTLTEMIGLRKAGRLVVRNAAQGYRDDDGVNKVVPL